MSRWVIGLGLAVACWADYAPRIHMKVRAPAGTTLDPAKLHLQNVAPAEAAANPYPTLAIHPYELTPIADGLDVSFACGIGPRCQVRVHAWYDTNGNGKVDAGDLVGDLAPAPFIATATRSLCSASVDNRAPGVVLAPVDAAPAASPATAAPARAGAAGSSGVK